MLKKVMMVLIGFVVLIGGCVGAVFWATADLPKAADAFFSAIAREDYAAAMALTSSDFKASTTQEELQTFAEDNGLVGYREASWSSRAIENSSGSLEGTLAMADGGSLPITVQLVKSGRGWQIQNIKKSEAGLSSGD